MSTPVIQTERLTLRGWRNSDSEALYRLNSDPEFVRYLGDGKPLSRDDSWRILAVLAGHWALKGFGLWAVELTETKEAIGRVGLWEPHGWPAIELGWGISPEHWGKGYATETARASLKWAFDDLGLESVISIIHPDNHASKSVALRIGESFSHTEKLKNINCEIYKVTRQTYYK
ncbi:GNAT family N-acetyltransferase [Endozoicomonas sp. OPT23]|uniref:GNAT family N-acetyltransferase n=1 Tax=Endozoicomonas sp. OPT23 TaxID=2072845 RepID=UPI00129AAE34|nr:GNAT family N-acetyltransferase [Endozoicomonas sp. OPT23]MRI34892.1 GNAT family N-acetyltransferase [Endozoicomonas sp. OPT23]